jgi:hypothetical protein
LHPSGFAAEATVNSGYVDDIMSSDVRTPFGDVMTQFDGSSHAGVVRIRFETNSHTIQQI